MILHEPFIISARLLPALRIGDGTLSLSGVGLGVEGRLNPCFILDTPDFEYVDDRMQTGVGGSGTVSMFVNFLGFLGAAAESYRYELWSRSPGENSDLFPRHVLEWAYVNDDEIACALSDICEPGSDFPREELIERG